MNTAPEFQLNDVEILSDTRVYDGFFKMHSIELRHKLFAGHWGKPIKRELFMRGQASGVLLFDPILEQVALIEQFRIGALTTSRHNDSSPWLLEIVAGIVESGESAEDVAIREAKEESGSEISELIPICEYLVSPGGTDESIALFCAVTDCSNLSGIHGLDEEGEDIRVHTLPIKDAFAAVESGRINNAATIVALQWLELNLLKQHPALKKPVLT